MLDHGADALASSQFLDLPLSFVQEILGNDHLQVPSEVSPGVPSTTEALQIYVFRAAMNWAASECKRRNLPTAADNVAIIMKDVLTLIRFPLMVCNVLTNEGY